MLNNWFKREVEVKCFIKIQIAKYDAYTESKLSKWVSAEQPLFSQLLFVMINKTAKFNEHILHFSIPRFAFEENW